MTDPLIVLPVSNCVIETYPPVPVILDATGREVAVCPDEPTAAALVSLLNSITSLRAERDDLAAAVDSLERNRLGPDGATSLREAAEAVAKWRGVGMTPNELFEYIAELFYKDTRMLRPGKDCRTGSPTREERSRAFDEWCDRKNKELNRQLETALGKS